MFFSCIFSKIREYFLKLFRPIVFNLDEEYKEILDKRKEFLKRNVLVGTVRRREQLPVNLSHNFYHIPMAQLISIRDIEYVALYQSKHLFGLETDTNGVVWYGRVTEAKEIKRSDIKEIPSPSGDLYAKFNVEFWEQISPPIAIGGKSPKVFLKTSFYQLSLAKHTCELFFDTAEKYVFYLGMWDLINEIYDGFDYLGARVVKRGKKIIFKKGKSKKSIKINEFKRCAYDKTLSFFEII